MLHPVAQLAGDFLRNINRVLRDEIDADALGTDQAHHLLHLLHQRIRCLVEQQVCFIKEEHQLGLFGVAHLGERFKQFGQQPQQEGRIEPRAVHQLVGRQDIHPAAALAIQRDEIGDVEGRLSEKRRAALAVERQQLALDRTDTGLGHIAIFARQFGRVVGTPGQHRLQILQIQQQQIMLIGIAEGDGEHAFLRVVQPHKPRQKQRPHFGNRGANGVTLLAEQIPEHDRHRFPVVILHLHFHGALGRPAGGLAAGLGHAGNIALHIGQEHRHAGAGKALSQTLQRDGLAGAGRAGDQPVAVGAFQHQGLRGVLIRKADEQGIGHA